MINVKILSLGASERYAVRRTVVAAQNELQRPYPRLAIQIREVGDATEIGRYATALILPTLVVDEKVVCRGHFPTKEEVISWLRKAIDNT